MIPRAEEQPTVSVSVAARWFGVSPATFYRAVAEGRAPCATVKVGSRVAVVTADARRVLHLEDEAD